MPHEILTSSGSMEEFGSLDWKQAGRYGTYRIIDENLHSQYERSFRMTSLSITR